MMKQVGMSMPDPPKMARFFAAGVRCMSVFDFSGEAARNEVKEIFEAFSDRESKLFR